MFGTQRLADSGCVRDTSSSQRKEINEFWGGRQMPSFGPSIGPTGPWLTSSQSRLSQPDAVQSWQNERKQLPSSSCVPSTVPRGKKHRLFRTSFGRGERSPAALGKLKGTSLVPGPVPNLVGFFCDNPAGTGNSHGFCTWAYPFFEGTVLAGGCFRESQVKTLMSVPNFETDPLGHVSK